MKCGAFLIINKMVNYVYLYAMCNQYFRYGPAEWIWRQLTYGKRLQLRK
ncbi:MAG: DUF418 domain-containing protein [Bacteroidota bacterium]